MTPEDFYKALKELGFDLSQKQKDQFQRYFELLVEWNEKNQSYCNHRKRRGLPQTFLRFPSSCSPRTY